MSLAERTDWRILWRERFHWARYYFILFGPLALVAETAYTMMGTQGLVAFTVPPALMMLSARRYLEKTEAAVAEVREANVRLRRAHRDTIAALSRSMEAKDLYTGGHTGRVAAVSVALARHLGYEGDDLEAIEIGALLHDIGKIGIPEQILRKAGPLDDDEWAIMRRHPVVSDFILAELDLHPIVRQCARSSHERIDGSGYPDRLSGEEVPLPARIVFVADAFDALTSDRPYRLGRSTEAALAEIEANTGTQFCPQVAAALREIWQASPEVLGADDTAADLLPRALTLLEVA
jgi:putative nucleotidyltransferase with HDIG domain